MPIIERVEVIDFKYDVKDMGAAFANAHNHVGYVEGSKLSLSKYAIVVECSDGSRGEYVALWGGTRPALAQTLMLASGLPGRDSDQREAFYTEWNRRLCHMDHMGQGPVDIVLWDLAGKQAGKSIPRMTGQYRNKLPTQAST